MRALAAAAGAIAALALYRARFIESAVCDAVAAPLACLPRSLLLRLAYQGEWGVAAVVIGGAAFLFRSAWLGALGLAVGWSAVMYYNVTWGMAGAALGAWGWLGGWRLARR